MLITFEEIKEHCPNITGVIHVGAHNGNEDYGDLPVKWIEADPDLFEALTVYPKYHFAATYYRGYIFFYRMPFSAANSLYKPNLNKRRKDVYVKEVIEVPADTISSIQDDRYNLLNMDIQGGELNALKGTDLSQIDYIYCEVHKVETYHGIPLIDEIDSYLTDYERVLTQWTKYGWGDALYIRL